MIINQAVQLQLEFLMLKLQPDSYLNINCLNVC